MAVFARWVPRDFAEAAIEAGLVSHNGSAMWIFELTQNYRPGNRIAKGSCLVAYELDDTATNNVKNVLHIDFEDDDFKGEGKHPNNIIVKNNEPGAYGIGVLRQKITNYHVTTRYATKKEVAKALGFSEKDDIDAYKPPNVTVWR
jgi:hypothetical protein